jgi:hypothetical protein
MAMMEKGLILKKTKQAIGIIENAMKIRKGFQYTVFTFSQARPLT